MKIVVVLQLCLQDVSLSTCGCYFLFCFVVEMKFSVTDYRQSQNCYVWFSMVPERTQNRNFGGASDHVVLTSHLSLGPCNTHQSFINKFLNYILTLYPHCLLVSPKSSKDETKQIIVFLNPFVVSLLT